MYTCCDLLERNPHCDNDLALVTCLRFSGINNQASDTMHERRFRTEQQDGLLLLGLETQTAQLKQRIPPRIAATSMCPPAIRLYTRPRGYQLTPNRAGQTGDLVH